MSKIYNNLTLIAAIGKNNELGKDNTLIWRFKEDMKFFKDNTMGKPIIMGRKTLESLPKLLPGREHIVLSSSNINIEGIKVFHSKDELLEYVSSFDKEFMVIGGASVYSEFINNASKMLITKIDSTCSDADVYFPSIDDNLWNYNVLSSLNENGINFKHLEYKRK